MEEESEMMPMEGKSTAIFFENVTLTWPIIVDIQAPQVLATMESKWTIWMAWKAKWWTKWTAWMAMEMRAKEW